MLIKNVAAALPGEDDFRLADILVENGRFAKIAAPGAFTDRAGLPGPKGDDILDAEGLMMFPGAIDPHVHFDEPGFTHREDFAHGTQEAARGGVTTVIDMPCTSLPPVTTIAALENKLSIVAPKAYVDFAFYGGISGQLPQAEIESAVETLSPKVVGFKCYTVSGMETFTAVNQQQFARAIALCAAAGRPLLLHAEDPEVIRQSTEALTAARGKSAAVWRDYYASRPEKAEVEACMAALRLAGKSAPWLHIVHVGTADAAKIAASGGASCETCAHYLAFDEEDFATQGASLKTAPPVKDPSQKALLWRLLADGTISYVTSDHAGAPDYEKFTGNPLTAYGGIPGTGTLFPYILSEGLFAKRLSLQRFLAATSGGAAKRFGLDRGKGSISQGKDADFVLVDPSATTLFDPSKMYSKSHITPFAGMRFAGRIAGTFVRGRCVFGTSRLAAHGLPAGRRDMRLAEDGWMTDTPGYGKFIQWGYA